MHYYINGNRSGDGKCFHSFEDSKVELIRIIMVKMKNADTEQILEGATALGEAAKLPYWGAGGPKEVTCGRDSWTIQEHDGYGCYDGDGVDW